MACMAVASFLQSAGSLCVKLSDGRIPVFQIVVAFLFHNYFISPKEEGAARATINSS